MFNILGVLLIACSTMFLATEPMEIADNELTWEPQGVIVDYIHLTPKFPAFSSDTSVIEFELINDSETTYLYGLYTTLLRQIDESWYIVPHYQGFLFRDVAIFLPGNEKHIFEFSVQEIHGILEEGTYALALNLYFHSGSREPDVCGSRIIPRIVLGTFSISNENK